ncbi:MAG: hypothetical protein PHO56_01245 [Patescibacteria group bacterium]|nr:hypothetical protein [Patescibacteria group bacterium]
MDDNLLKEPARIKVYITCGTAERNELLRKSIGKVSRLIDVVDNIWVADLFIVDEVGKTFVSSVDHSACWFIYIPDPESKISFNFPTNVWIFPLDELLQSSKIADLFSAFSIQKEYRTAKVDE